jgi:hypothetical protein
MAMRSPGKIVPHEWPYCPRCGREMRRWPGQSPRVWWCPEECIVVQRRDGQWLLQSISAAGRLHTLGVIPHVRTKVLS